MQKAFNMELKKITETITVSPQITATDIPTIKEAGFRAIICNRPDGESADQPAFAEIEAQAKALGLEVRYQPVMAVSDADAASFAKLLEDLPKPVLAYCRSGTRCATLWSLAHADRLPMTDILAATKAAGYDMTGLVPRLAQADKSPADAPRDMVRGG